MTQHQFRYDIEHNYHKCIVCGRIWLGHALASQRRVECSPKNAVGHESNTDLV